MRSHQGFFYRPVHVDVSIGSKTAHKACVLLFFGARDIFLAARPSGRISKDAAWYYPIHLSGENLPASMAARLRAIVLRAKSRKSLTIVKRISSIPIGFGCDTSCFVGD